MPYQIFQFLIAQLVRKYHLSSFNCTYKLIQILDDVWRSAEEHLENNNPNGPYITFCRVVLGIKYLRTHIDWAAHQRFMYLILLLIILKHFRETKVCNLVEIILNKNVCRL